MKLCIKVIMLSWIVLTSCQPQNTAKQITKYKIVATTSILADAVRQIAGDSVELTGLMGPGVDPHLYKPTHGDIEAMSNADIIIYNGLHLEGKMQEILEKIGRQKKVIAAGDGIANGQLHYPAEFKSAPDPHIWFDVNLWNNALTHISGKLQQIDTLHSEYYNARTLAYTDTLHELDKWVKERIAEIPANRRVLITAHDAFGYFGTAYAIDVRGLQGISTMSEYGIRDIQDLSIFLSKNKIPAVFVESSVPRKALEAVVSACRERGHKVVIGGSLYSDALGDKASGANTYTGMVRANVNTIVEALKN